MLHTRIIKITSLQKLRDQINLRNAEGYRLVSVTTELYPPSWLDARYVAFFEKDVLTARECIEGTTNGYE